MDQNAKIYIAGHRGMVGSGIERKLRKEGYHNIVTRTSSELDLRHQQAVNYFFEKEKPAYVILAAAKVGGIHANNTYKAEFIYDNLMIEANIIHASYLNKVAKLLFFGSSCVYPKMASQPLKEEYLLSGYLEPTNQSYAIAKISGIELCNSYRSQYGCNFISVMPANLYGINDNYHQENSHVLPALIRRLHEAKINSAAEVIIWGSGSPKREFLFADDLADACFFLIQNYNDKELINIGTGQDMSIHELALLIKSVVGFEGKLAFDKSKPDGTPRKLMDVSKLNDLGWTYKTRLEEGIKLAYPDFLSNVL